MNSLVITLNGSNVFVQEELRILKGSEGAARKTKKVKTEAKTEPHSLLQSGEIIDLT